MVGLCHTDTLSLTHTHTYSCMHTHTNNTDNNDNNNNIHQKTSWFIICLLASIKKMCFQSSKSSHLVYQTTDQRWCQLCLQYLLTETMEGKYAYWSLCACWLRTRGGEWDNSWSLCVCWLRTRGGEWDNSWSLWVCVSVDWEQGEESETTEVCESVCLLTENKGRRVRQLLKSVSLCVCWLRTRGGEWDNSWSLCACWLRTRGGEWDNSWSLCVCWLRTRGGEWDNSWSLCVCSLPTDWTKKEESVTVCSSLGIYWLETTTGEKCVFTEVYMLVDWKQVVDSMTVYWRDAFMDQKQNILYAECMCLLE